MTQTETTRTRGAAAGRAAGLTVAGVTAIALLVAASPAAAQMFERAYGFAPRDRASLAVIMKQAESGMFEPQRNTATNTGAGGLNYTVNNLICGGDSGSANADANSACIILNNSNDSLVGAGQDAIGNQDAASSVDTTQNNNTSGSLSTALEGMSGSDSAAGGSANQTQPPAPN